MLGDLVPIAVVGFFFLQAGRIGQKNLQKIGRAPRTINRPAKTVIDEARQIASVIDVRMSNDDRVNGSRVERWLLPIAIAQLVPALK